MVNRLRSNHYNLNESLSRENYIDSSHCKCGAERQDIDHVVFKCRQYDDARNELYRQLEALEAEYSYVIEDWLRGPVVEPLKKVWIILKKIQRII